MKIPETIERYRGYLENERLLRPDTIRAYTSDLGGLNEFIEGRDVETVTLDDLRAYKRYLSEGGAQRATIRRKLGGLSTYFKWLKIEGVNHSVPTDGLTVPPRKRKEPRYLTVKELHTFLETEPGISHMGDPVRDKCAFRLLVFTGLRRGELLNLKIEDVNLEERVIVVRDTKSGDDRSIPFEDETLIQQLRAVIGERESGYIFTSSTGNQWGYSSFAIVFKRHAVKCGLMGVTPHSLRHSYATHLARGGTQITELADLLGHKEIRTTRQYMHSSPETLRAAVKNHPLAGAS